jgi:hypothetical protein
VNINPNERIRVKSLAYTANILSSSPTYVTVAKIASTTGILAVSNPDLLLLTVSSGVIADEPNLIDRNSGGYISDEMTKEIHLGVQGSHETAPTGIQYILKVEVWSLSDSELFELV